MRYHRFKTVSIRNVGDLKRLVEHGAQGRGDILRRIGLEKEIRRCAVFKTGQNIRDIGVRDIIFIVEDGGWILDRLIGNIEHGNDDTAVLEWRTERRGTGRHHRGAVASRKATAGLKVLCAVGYEENKRLRIGR